MSTSSGMEQPAENYQLKWHSFSTYIHSCIATSLQNESFADVALVTMDGGRIMAHRYVLSACSQYLHEVLKLHQKSTISLPLVVILPPEITYKTLRTLIQYMYSGEATVSKDILELVLRSGDLLKVKGLWRPKEDENQDSKLVKVSHRKGSMDNKSPKSPKVPKTASKEGDPITVLNYTLHVAKNQEQASKEKIKVVVSQNGECKTAASSQNSVIRSTEDERRLTTTKDSLQKRADRMHDEEDDEETMQYLVIKEEPVEWCEVNNEEMELVDEKEVFTTELSIKPEVFMDEEEEEEGPATLYSPLTCELCTETFTEPAEWVRHVQTHTDMLPAKRQRRGRGMEDDPDAPFPQLHCDLCQKYFPTPAEWVHHIQNTHTEFELHLSNKTATGREVNKPPKAYTPAQNLCHFCAKKFPSHASLLIHKRTHTGEKPYMCEMCSKGFNVKSNLLRHLRTVHDKIINPTDVDDNT